MLNLATFWSIAGGLLLVTVLLLETGRRVGARRRVADPEGANAGLGAIEGAVFGLMGLLIAFTFSGAAARFDNRRAEIGQEANTIGTAYLRIDLLPASAQSGLREDFRTYTDLRIETFRKIRRSIQGAEQDYARSVELQNKIWKEAVVACQQQASPAVTTLVLSSFNDMIDITTTRLVSAQTHPPEIIFYGLGVLVLATSLLAGYGMAAGKSRSWLHMILYALIMSASLYTILDLEYPRVGLIRLDSADQVLIDLRNSMK
jgi:hypothetical protein